jgi:hypothetical protein
MFGYLQWLALKTNLSTVPKLNSEDKTFNLLITQPLKIAFVSRRSASLSPVR